MKSRPTVIVLACGRGSRFHDTEHKLDEPLGTSTVLAITLHQALSSQLSVLVVTTPTLSTLVSQHVATRDMVVMPDTETHTTLGQWIAAGVALRSNASGWLVLPADMPLVAPSTLRAVARELDHHPVAVAQHRGMRGHPIGYAAELYSELVTLTSDQEARRLISRYPAQDVEVDDPGVLLGANSEKTLAEVRQVHDAARLARQAG